MALTIKPPTNELGQPGGHHESWHHQQGPGFIATGYEETPELEFPASVAVYDRMRKTEGQIASVLRAINLPILANRRRLATEGVRDVVVRFVETELGLTEDTGRARRRRHGIILTEHLRQALLALPLGFMPFEVVYEPGPPTVDQADLDLPDVVYHLRKLGPRLPRTISEIRVQRDGGLEGILQAGIGWDTSGQGSGVQVIGGPSPSDNHREVFIPAHRLVVYCFDREGADWTGQSLLRAAYKNWLLKDQLIRTDALAGERNGMGLPMVYFAEDGNREEALQIAQGMRAGAYAGGALPDKKYRAELLGTTGTIKDLLPSIKYHDEAMGRSALAMFLNLGHDNGARSLGETFVDYFVMSLRATDDWLNEIVTEEIIRRLVAANFGPDEPYPVLESDEISAEGTPTAEGLKTLTDAGLLTPDETLEAEVRRRYGLPKADPKQEPAVPEVEIEPMPGYTEDPADLDKIAENPGDDHDPLLATAERLITRIAKLRSAGAHV